MMSSLSRFQNLLLPVGIIICLMVILTPLPTGVMDLLLIANIAVSVIVLMTSIYIKTPLEFSVFPTVLLSTVLARLVLNIGTTRLILTKAATDGTDAAGGVIQSFGKFVAGDQLLVGLILFSIIAVIQFVVITKGATRISEVTARFILDGLPGRQMAIDADLNAHSIDDKEARRRRDDLMQQTDFYGAMDGASKFVRGDAVASVFVTVINIVGGVALGVLYYEMPPTEALTVFTKLTIGDGLVSQVPALLVSLAAGILVTRSTQRTDLSLTVVKQVFARPDVLAVAGVFLLLLIMTSLPTVPLFVLGTGCVGVAFMIAKHESAPPETVESKPAPKKTNVPKEPRIEDFLLVDPVEVELGIGLLRLADNSRGGNMLQEVNRLRKKVALEMGIVMPTVRFRDNLQLGEDTYRIRVNGNVITTATLPLKGLIAIRRGEQGQATRSYEPFDHPMLASAFKIDVEEQQHFEPGKFSVLDATSLFTSHLSSVVEEFSSELLTRDATKHLIDELKQRSPAVVGELIPNVLKLNQVQRVLKNLLAERIPIRQLGLILEALGDAYRPGQTMAETTESVRQRMARTICQRYRDSSSRLYAITLAPSLENRIANSITHSQNGFSFQLDRQTQADICEDIRRELDPLTKLGRPTIVLVDQRVRPLIRPLVHQTLPQLVALSYDEITSDTKVVSLGIVSREDKNGAES